MDELTLLKSFTLKLTLPPLVLSDPESPPTAMRESAIDPFWEVSVGDPFKVKVFDDKFWFPFVVTFPLSVILPIKAPAALPLAIAEKLFNALLALLLNIYLISKAMHGPIFHLLYTYILEIYFCIFLKILKQKASLKF